MAKKKKKRAEVAVPDGNVILFTALSMIMLAFFIVLNSIAVIDTNRKLAALGSLLGSFGILPGGVLLEKGDQLLPYESPILNDGEMYDDVLLRAEKFIVDYQLSDEVGFNFEGKNLVISISTELLFMPGQAALDSRNLPFLNLITRLVASIGNRVRIEGFLTSEEVALYKEKNSDLSIHRAIKIMNYMTERGNIAPERFSVGGYDAEKPVIVSGDELKKKDGRIEITLLGEVKLTKKEDDVYRYKEFKFDFKKDMSGGR